MDQSQEDRIEVAGRIVQLPNDRSVFLGRHPTLNNSNVIRFTNGEQKISFGLSDEALLALIALANSDPVIGIDGAITFPAPDTKAIYGWTVKIDLDDEVTEPTNDQNSTEA